MRTRYVRAGLATTLVVTMIAGVVFVVVALQRVASNHIVAYFDNTNGLFHGDEVRVLGVPVGAVETIEPQGERVKVTFWVNKKYRVPADAKAAIVSPQLVTARAIQLVPAYTGGPVMADGAEIPETRTAVPLEWDDLRKQLEKLSDALQPTEPGGVSTLGAFINTAADNLRGQGPAMRDTVIKLSRALSALGDHSGDIFGTIKNLSVVVSALQDSAGLLRQLNQNLASATALLTNTPGAIGNAMKELNEVVGEATQFISEHRDAVGTSTDKLASISTTIYQNLDQIKQALHVFPNAAASFSYIYQPAQAAVTGALAINNFANPITFLCGAIQAASRLNAERSAKLCVQYLAPIIKNRQYNFPPIGENLIVGAQARPNEVTYSEPWLRPDYVPPQATPAEPSGPAPVAGPPRAAGDPPLPAEATPPAAPVGAPPAAMTDPSTGLQGIMVPTGSGS